MQMATRQAEHWDQRTGGETRLEAGSRLKRRVVIANARPRWDRSGRSMVDVGGGSSPLAGAFLERGHSYLRCSTSLALVYEQLIGAQVPPLKRCNGWLVMYGRGPSRRYAVRHDRALFHCRSTDQDRDAYLRTLDEAIGTERAVVIIATFARRMARSGARASSCRSAPLILRPPEAPGGR